MSYYCLKSVALTSLRESFYLCITIIFIIVIENIILPFDLLEEYIIF